MHFGRQLLAEAASLSSAWNRLEYRPLEGFVLAITRSTSPRSRQPAHAPALMGNVVVWAVPHPAAVRALLMRLLEAAGLPPA